MALPSTNPSYQSLGDAPEALAPSPNIGMETGSTYPNPNVSSHPYIYLAVYSSVPVYEMMVRGIGVMRRRSDSYLNATQILKVAGVEKGRRTKILDKDVALGVHEKIQGGYGRYQGTWIPFERALELANTYNVSAILEPLFSYTAPPPPATLGIISSNNGAPLSDDTIMRTDQSSSATNAHASTSTDMSRKRSRESHTDDDFKRAKLDLSPTINGFGGPAYTNGGLDQPYMVKASTKPAGPHDTSLVDDPHRTERYKTSLKSLFAIESESINSLPPDLSATFPPDLDPDTPIDDNDHTALHWAAALARISVVRALIDFGADMYRGNNMGETALIRAVLVTNNSDQDSFPRLLEYLGPSLRTVDDTGRTVLHHAALVSAVKGRASAARYYMESVLEYVARFEGGQYKELVDAQDVHGDTALNIAARVGNKGLVRMLVEVGADKVRANKLGLRPGDFGIEGANLEITPAEQVLASIQGPPTILAPIKKSHEVISEIGSLVDSLSTDFAAELKGKTDNLDRTRLQLQTLTKQLSEQRKEITLASNRVSQVEEKSQRIQNLERAIQAEDSFDWTGRTEINGTPARIEVVGASFTYRGPGSTLSNLPAGISIEFDADPPAPATDEANNSLVHLLRLRTWYERVVGLLKDRVGKLEGGSADMEGRLQKVVASCAGVEPESVDGMLEGLCAALESDGSGVDLARVASFLSRVKDGTLV